MRAIENLAAYATTYRYVNSSGRIVKAPPAEDVKAHIERVASALAAAAAAFQVEFADATSPARKPGPAR